MSFLTRQNSIIITGPGDFSATPTAVEEIPEINDEGWDSLTLTYVVKKPTLTAEEVAKLFPIGTRLDARFWWVVGASPKLVAAGFWLITVKYKGWAITKPIKVKVGASAEQQSGQNIRTPKGTYAKVEVHEPGITVAVSYLVEDVDATTPESASKTDKVGKELVPPVIIKVPDSVWAYLTTFVYHFPNGWVLMGSEQDRLVGTTAALVTDNYKYIRDKTPA